VSGVDTQATANAFLNQFFINSAGGRDQIFDNVDLWDDTAKAAGSNDLDDWNTSPIGVYTLKINGAGDNADFNSSGTTGHVDTFVHESLPVTAGTVIGVSMNTESVLTDATPHTLKHRYRSGTSNTDSSAFTVTGSIKNDQTNLVLDPATGVAPTVSDVNSMKVGYVVAS
jgi:hypothetical protein